MSVAQLRIHLRFFTSRFVNRRCRAPSHHLNRMAEHGKIRRTVSGQVLESDALRANATFVCCCPIPL
jgi:hypothetical protein